MGSWHDAATVQAMIDALPEGAVLALDEAYSDTAPEGAIPPLDLSHPRVIRFRTFSKAYGLAGLRVGYGLAAPELVAAFNRIRNHFGVGRLAQAGAMAALADQGHLMRVVNDIAAARDRIGEIARRNGLTPLPSATNFVTIDCGRDGDFARAVLSGLVARGIFVRMPFTPPQDRCIRVSCGPAPALDAFAAALAGRAWGSRCGGASRARDLPSRVEGALMRRLFREVHMLTRFTLAAVLAAALLPGAAPAQSSGTDHTAHAATRHDRPGGGCLPRRQ
jgi:histidinol-phosphate/aromatic aminotransferase/cobyric acid decarboxylase-like protein